MFRQYFLVKCSTIMELRIHGCAQNTIFEIAVWLHNNEISMPSFKMRQSLIDDLAPVTESPLMDCFHSLDRSIR